MFDGYLGDEFANVEVEFERDDDGGCEILAFDELGDHFGGERGTELVRVENGLLVDAGQQQRAERSGDQ